MFINKENKNNDGTDKKMTAVIVGESMVSYLNAKRLKRSMPTINQNIHVEHIEDQLLRL